MLVKPDCIPCLLKGSLAAIRVSTDDPDVEKSIAADILNIPEIRNNNWQILSPELYEKAITIIKHRSGLYDPFAGLKEKQNKRAMELYPKFKARVAESDDPLMAAVKLAIMGNHSDLLMFENSSDLANHIDKALQANLPQDIWRAFKEKLKKGKTILYFGDNAGEIVLDRILIELIRERYENEVVYVVKKEAALNDSTMKEGLQVGMDQVATLIGNGIDGPLPGTIISRCSREVQRLFKGAEMIISKGGGNYDSLDEEDSNRSNIFFMLLAKCYPYCRVFNTHLFSYVLAT